MEELVEETRRRIDIYRRQFCPESSYEDVLGQISSAMADLSLLAAPTRRKTPTASSAAGVKLSAGNSRSVYKKAGALGSEEEIKLCLSYWGEEGMEFWLPSTKKRKTLGVPVGASPLVPRPQNEDMRFWLLKSNRDTNVSTSVGNGDGNGGWKKGSFAENWLQFARSKNWLAKQPTTKDTTTQRAAARNNVITSASDRDDDDDSEKNGTSPMDCKVYDLAAWLAQSPCARADNTQAHKPQTSNEATTSGTGDVVRHKTNERKQTTTSPSPGPGVNVDHHETMLSSKWISSEQHGRLPPWTVTDIKFWLAPTRPPRPPTVAHTPANRAENVTGKGQKYYHQEHAVVSSSVRPPYAVSDLKFWLTDASAKALPSSPSPSPFSPSSSSLSQVIPGSAKTAVSSSGSSPYCLETWLMKKKSAFHSTNTTTRPKLSAGHGRDSTSSSAASSESMSVTTERDSGVSSYAGYGKWLLSPKQGEPEASVVGGGLHLSANRGVTVMGGSGGEHALERACEAEDYAFVDDMSEFEVIEDNPCDM